MKLVAAVTSLALIALAGSCECHSLHRPCSHHDKRQLGNVGAGQPVDSAGGTLGQLFPSQQGSSQLLPASNNGQQLPAGNNGQQLPASSDGSANGLPIGSNANGQPQGAINTPAASGAGGDSSGTATQSIPSTIFNNLPSFLGISFPGEFQPTPTGGIEGPTIGVSKITEDQSSVDGQPISSDGGESWHVSRQYLVPALAVVLLAAL